MQKNIKNAEIMRKNFLTSTDKESLREVFGIAIPITFQNILTCSFSLVDQIMIGSLGTNAIAAVAFGGKISMIFTTIILSFSTAISIMVSQYWGKKDMYGISKSVCLNALYSIIVSSIFIILGFFFPASAVGIFTKDPEVIPIAAEYLKILSISFIPLLGFNVLAPLFRNIGYSKHLLYISLLSLFVNTSLNYVLILGKFNFPAMEARGAAIATVISKFVEFIFLLILLSRAQKKVLSKKLVLVKKFSKDFQKKALCIIFPSLISQLLWSIGDTTYGIIYGRMSSESMAAMSTTYPLQGISMALFSGFSAAAGILIGNQLGKKEYDKSYKKSKTFFVFSIFFSLILSGILFMISDIYPKLYNLPVDVSSATSKIIRVFAMFVTVKICMSLLSAFLGSGGKTKYLAIIGSLGTFCIGIPIGFISAFVLKLPIEQVYFLISIEELIRCIICIFIWRSKSWIKNITDDKETSKT